MQVGSISPYGYSTPAHYAGAASISRRSSLAIDTNGDRRPEVSANSSSGVAASRGRDGRIAGYDRNGVAVDNNSDGRKDARVENEIRFAARAGGYRGSAAVTTQSGYALRSGNTQVQGKETTTVTAKSADNRDGSRTTALETKSQENTRLTNERGTVTVNSSSRDRVAETVKKNGERSSEVTSASSLKVSGSGNGGDASSSVSSSVTVKGANAGRVSIAIAQSVSNIYASVQQASVTTAKAA